MEPADGGSQTARCKWAAAYLACSVFVACAIVLYSGPAGGYLPELSRLVHINNKQTDIKTDADASEYCNPEATIRCIGNRTSRVCWEEDLTPTGGVPYRMLFHSSELGWRGVPVSTYSYAEAFERVVGGQAFISSFKYPPEDSGSAPKFEARFGGRTLYLRQPAQAGVEAVTADLHSYLVTNGIRALYTQQNGAPARPGGDMQVQVVLSPKPNGAAMLVHAVFDGTAPMPFYRAYTTISEVIPHDPAITPTVHYIAYMNESHADAPGLWDELRIPSDATVICRHGGYDTFDMQYVRSAVCAHARANPSTYFVLQNTKPECEGGIPNIIHLGPNADLYYKRRFLNSCNACIHGRSEGETFGLAVAECSLAGLPVFIHANARTDANFHVKTLGSEGLLYGDDEASVLQQLRAFNATAAKAKAEVYKSLYEPFSPVPMMLEFLSTFKVLDEVIHVQSGGKGTCVPRPQGA